MAFPRRSGQNPDECSDPGYGISLIYLFLRSALFLSSFQFSFCFQLNAETMRTLQARGS